MKTSKRLTCHGGITIPKDMRLQLGWVPGMSVDIEPSNDGTLLIKPHSDRCRFCGAVMNTRKYKGVCICVGCIESMKEEIA